MQDRNLRRHGRERIAALSEARAAQRKQVLELLAPLSLSARRTDPNLDRSGSLHSKLPRQQGLTSYYSNVFRDWSWDNGENDKLFECVGCVLQSETTFVHRQDAHVGRRRRPSVVRPAPALPSRSFRRARYQSAAGVSREPRNRRRPRSLHEFPIAPLNNASFAVLRECAAPEPLAAELARVRSRSC